MAFSAVLAVGLAVSAAGYEQQRKASNQAKDDRAKSLQVQEQGQAQQKADNAAQAAQEQRNQVRESRVKTAKILQASQNTGVSGSSGEFGAVGGINTQLSSNTGFNMGRIMTANNLSDLRQQQANFEMSAQNALIDAQNGEKLFNLGMSISSKAGSF